MTELKPCPFCGDKGKLITETSCGSSYAYCRCVNCKARTIRSKDENNDGTFIFKAIEAWNRRVGDSDDNTGSN